MTFPTPYTVGVRTYSTTGTDAHGNAVAEWSEPVDVAVYAIAPNVSSEPLPGRDEVITGLIVLAPDDVPIGPHDRLVIDGEEWDVDGEIGNWNRGPWGWEPGIQIVVKRAEG